MTNDPTPDPTRWWLLWLLSTVVLPPLSGWGVMQLLKHQHVFYFMLAPILLISSLWLLIIDTKKICSAESSAMLAAAIIGGLVLQVSTGFFGCLASLNLGA